MTIIWYKNVLDVYFEWFQELRSTFSIQRGKLNEAQVDQSDSLEPFISLNYLCKNSIRLNLTQDEIIVEQTVAYIMPASTQFSIARHCDSTSAGIHHFPFLSSLRRSHPNPPLHTHTQMHTYHTHTNTHESTLTAKSTVDLAHRYCWFYDVCDSKGVIYLPLSWEC